MVSEWISNSLIGIKNPKPLLIYGNQGSGKSLFSQMMIDKVSGKRKSTRIFPVNWRKALFNSFLDTTFAVVDELAMEELDEAISISQKKTLTISRMAEEDKEITNAANYLILSNIDIDKLSDNQRDGLIISTPVFAIASLYYLTA